MLLATSASVSKLQKRIKTEKTLKLSIGPSWENGNVPRQGKYVMESRRSVFD